MDCVGENPGLFQVGMGAFEPEYVGVGRVGQAPGDDGLHPAIHPEISLGGPLAGDEALVRGVDVAGQERGVQGVRPGKQHGGNAGHVGGQTGRVQRADKL